MDINILLFDEFEPLDVFGPAEFFYMQKSLTFNILLCRINIQLSVMVCLLLTYYLMKKLTRVVFF